MRPLVGNEASVQVTAKSCIVGPVTLRFEEIFYVPNVAASQAQRFSKKCQLARISHIASYMDTAWDGSVLVKFKAVHVLLCVVLVADLKARKF